MYPCTCFWRLPEGCVSSSEKVSQADDFREAKPWDESTAERFSCNLQPQHFKTNKPGS